MILGVSGNSSEPPPPPASSSKEMESCPPTSGLKSVLLPQISRFL
jgi:hypothetical protein